MFGALFLLLLFWLINTFCLKYFLSFIDDCTRVSWVNLLKSKNNGLYLATRCSVLSKEIPQI